MKKRRLPIITSLVLVALIIATGVVLADHGPNGQHDDGTGSTLEGNFSTVSGGENNKALGDHSTVGGGAGNKAFDDSSTVGGGVGNEAHGDSSTVGGGLGNETSSAGGRSTVGGGQDNVAGDNHATVGGGLRNKAINSDFATVGGGQDNTASGNYSTVGGGQDNTASEFHSTVGGGEDNTASGITSTVGGGHDNTASGHAFSTVGGGVSNTASGHASTVPGGSSNVAAGDGSFAAGHKAKANHNGTFVWADSKDEDFTSTKPDQFLIRASGGVVIASSSTDPTELRLKNMTDTGSSQIVFEEDQQGDNMIIRYHSDPDNHRVNQLQFLRGAIPDSRRPGFDAPVIRMVIDRDDTGNVGIGTESPTERLHVNGNVLANNFNTASSVRWKGNIEAIEGALEKVQSLRGVSYDWKETGEHQIGLIAEEVGEVIPEVVVYEENGLDAKAVDYARLVPVLIEAVKEQQGMLGERDAEIAALQARITALEEAMGIEAPSSQARLLPFDTSMMWLIGSGLGLLLVAPGLVLGYRTFRRGE